MKGMRHLGDLSDIELPEYEPEREARVMKLWEKSTKYGLTPEEEAECDSWLTMRRDALRKAIQEGRRRETLPFGQVLDSPLRSWTPPKIPAWRM